MNFLYRSYQKSIRSLIWVLFTILYAIRPLLGPDGVCRYELSCTDYARMQFKDHAFFKACWLILKRFLSCSII